LENRDKLLSPDDSKSDFEMAAYLAEGNESDTRTYPVTEDQFAGRT
jgi:hypothetical protein